MTEQNSRTSKNPDPKTGLTAMPYKVASLAEYFHTSSLSKTALVGGVANYSNSRFTHKTVEELKRLLDAAQSGQGARQPAETHIRHVSRRLGTHRVQQLIDDYEAGSHTTELMATFGLSKSSVLKILHENHVRMRRQSMNHDQISSAIDLYRGGDSLATIATKLQIPKQSIRDSLIRSGVVMRSPSAKLPYSQLSSEATMML